MNDDDQTRPAPSMDDLIRGRRADRQRAAYERMFRAIVKQPTEQTDSDDGDDTT